MEEYTGGGLGLVWRVAWSGCSDSFKPAPGESLFLLQNPCIWPAGAFLMVSCLEKKGLPLVHRCICTACRPRKVGSCPTVAPHRGEPEGQWWMEVLLGGRILSSHLVATVPRVRESRRVTCISTGLVMVRDMEGTGLKTGEKIWGRGLWLGLSDVYSW